MTESSINLDGAKVSVASLALTNFGMVMIHSRLMALSIQLSAPEMRRLAEMLANCAVEIDRAQNRVAGESAGHAV